MDYKKFSLFTLLGSAIWCAVLCWLGVKMGQDEKLMAGEMHRITLWLGGQCCCWVHSTISSCIGT